ncbi:PREDICTED: uncharacterized protein LOC109212826 [Nicotiana attenuata]|uniref:uncharacterized protein LOC109212826 n=1 Tax=Nicotiana attenuata TaxID=49451 RepID=UPI0009059F6D|nr:PREDICTED: uncharacterized protein LOC109212826 [Nicotiana attenuata]
MLNQIIVTVPFVEALEKIPGYAKFMKDLVTKKKNVNFETVKVTHQCSVIISQAGVKKMEDPGAFAIPCTIGVTSFAKALCDLGATDFLILYCEVDREVRIILVRPFLATERAICDVEAGELKFCLNDEEEIFHIQKSIKQSHGYGVISVIDIVDEIIDKDMQEMCHDESLRTVVTT